jgi:hypothetical protein
VAPPRVMVWSNASVVAAVPPVPMMLARVPRAV